MGFFRRDMWKEEDILLVIPKEGDIYFSALIAVKYGQKKEYDEKDINLVDRIIGFIQREELEWWEVRESESGGWWLYYYPMRWIKSISSKTKMYDDYCIDLKRILERFNWLVKE